MFGYVRPSDGRLTEADRETFRGAYCGLCHTLGRRYGLAGRMILNYDLTFLAMVLSRGTGETCLRRCAVHPFRKRRCAAGDPAFDTAADMSVILTWWQLRDGVADHGFWGGWKYRFLSLLLHRAYRKAKARQPELDKRIQTNLDKLSALEREKCTIPDEAADTFALLLRDMAALSPPGIKRRVLEEMLYHLGRWIYLVDALDDLKEDSRSGSYNPLLQRYGTRDGALRPEDRERVAATLDASIRTMAAAFELTDFGCWRRIIESVVYEGLYAVGNAVLNGTFQKYTRNRKSQRKGRTQ